MVHSSQTKAQGASSMLRKWQRMGAPGLWWTDPLREPKARPEGPTRKLPKKNSHGYVLLGTTRISLLECPPSWKIQFRGHRDITAQWAPRASAATPVG